MRGGRGSGYFLTGSPGVGKSTIFKAIVEELSRLGCIVGGIAAPEVREQGRRIGFKLIDLRTGEEAWLARAGHPSPARVGRYGVLVEEAERLGAGALRRAVREAHVIGIDEIGPMELLAPGLREAIKEALLSGKPVVGVVHRRLRQRDPEIYRLVAQVGPVVEVTLENRDKLLASTPEVASSVAARAGCCEGGQGSDTC
ncbi:MAG: NTPase [Desulfurococcales archaeon]|nr:NTPase [Desulfurococcales archaeon]